jgi:GNAT superfamily N-acetyltransferase
MEATRNNELVNYIDFKHDNNLLDKLLEIQIGQYRDHIANFQSGINRATNVIVYFIDNIIVGYLFIGINNFHLNLNNNRPNVYLGTMAILPEYTGLGIGGKLYNKAIEISINTLNFTKPLFWGLFTSKNAIKLRKYFNSHSPKDDGSYSDKELEISDKILSNLTGYSKSLDHPFKLINEKSHFIIFNRCSAILNPLQNNENSYFDLVQNDIKS